MLKRIQLPNKVYDVLKIVALIIVPVTILISSLGDIWGLPYQDQIVKTLGAIDVFLGSLLEISSANYNRQQQANYEIPEPEIDESEAKG